MSRNRRMVIAAGPVALATAVLAPALEVDAARAAFPGANGRIAFEVESWTPADPCLPDPHGCEPSPSSSIETVLPSGRGRREVYRPSVGRVRPDWSPNGSRLAFQLGGRLAWIRGDGTGLRPLPQLTEAEHDPAWSPDGRRLAFIGNRRCFGCSWLYTVRRDGTALRRISGEHASWPAWSVRGRIAFANDDDMMGDRIGVRDGLYSIEPDGSKLRRVFTRRWGGVQQPDWSPDGRTIAFHARDNIFTVGADGRDLKRLTEPKETLGQGSTDPAWSPDGRQIAFIRDGDLYVMRASGRGVRRVVDAPAQSLDPTRPWAVLSAPSWQPLPR